MTKYKINRYECDRCGAIRESQEHGGADGWRRIWVIPSADGSTEQEGAYYLHLCGECAEHHDKFMENLKVQVA